MQSITSNLKLRPAAPFQAELVRGRASRGVATALPTNAFERILLFLTISLLPLQEELPSIAGFSGSFFIFAVVVGYVVVFRIRCLERILPHPLFLTAYGMLILWGVIEAFHPNPRYAELFRVAQTVIGAVSLAVLCRDTKALQAAIYGFLAMGTWVSAHLFLTTYGILAGSAVTDFAGATVLRAEAGSEAALVTNPNTLGFFAAQGAIVSLGMILATASSRLRLVYCGTAVLCAVGVFLTMSRGAVAILVLCCAAILFSAGLRHSKALLAAALLILVVVVLIPDAVLARMVFAPQQSLDGRQEGRTRVYSAFVEHLPEYIWTGIGNGNFWGDWGLNSSFAKTGVTGAHNSFFAVTIYWGLPGLLALLAVIFQGYRYAPARTERHPLALCVLGTSVSVLGFLMVMHVVGAKQFALGLGVLVGARYWVWPTQFFRPLVPISHRSGSEGGGRSVLRRVERHLL